MKYKRSLMVISLVICILFGISSVVASDINEIPASNQNETDLLMDSQQFGESLAADDVSPLSTTHKVNGTTFDDIKNTISSANDGDIIELSGTYTGKSKIIIDKAITINGVGAVLDSNHSSGILECYDKTITLNNITFCNGYSDHGGAIYAESYLVINGCNFVNNQAYNNRYSAGYGGAIYSLDNLNLTNCSFNNNEADSSSRLGGFSSAIYCKNKTILNHCEFTQNIAHRGYYDSDYSIISSGSLEAYDSKFYKNEGIIDVGSSLKMSGCTFRDNYGGIDVSGNAKIDNCIFYHNDGRILGLRGSNSQVSNVKFQKNYGADSIISLFGNKATISKCSFSDNIANEVIYFGILNSKSQGSINSVLTGLKFSNNSPWYGGFVQYVNGVLKLDGYSSCSGNIVVNVNGHVYKAKFSSGTAKIKLAGLAKGTYKAVISYSGDGSYAPYKVTLPVTLKTSTIPIKLALAAVKVKKSTNLVLKASLKQGKTPIKAKWITFKFNGKTLKAKTNGKGIAKVVFGKKILKNLKVGKKVKYIASYGKLKVQRTAKVMK